MKSILVCFASRSVNKGGSDILEFSDLQENTNTVLIQEILLANVEDSMHSII